LPTGKFADIVRLGKTFFTHLGAEMSDVIRIQTIEKRLDVNGKKFKKLKSKRYIEAKEAGTLRRAGAQEAVANLHLTGDMMNALQPTNVQETEVTVSWVEQSEKLKGNAARGRVVTKKSKPVSKLTERYIQKEVDKKTKANIKKTDGVTIIKAGK